MYVPWQALPAGYQVMAAPVPLMMSASGGFPVPESLSPTQFPEASRSAILRVLEGPPKPSVSLAVMNQTQATMIGPSLPW